ncbi:MAG: hypothetical protein FWC50_02895 [Planctomycetaceae bacterium]|nr:hypothetical protein [Planctomycetaceae bacterium]
MDKLTHYRNTLIQRYTDQTISEDELHELQSMLKTDALMRQELLLYVRMDIAIQDYVLFHNYMEETSLPDIPVNAQVKIPGHIPAVSESILKHLLDKIFPDQRPQAAK